MTTTTAQGISGFEFQTEGTLLTRVISEGDTGFCHERSVVYRKSWHCHDRLNIAFPRGGSVLRFKAKSGLEVKIEPNQFAMVPAHVPHMHWAETMVWNNFALFPSHTLVEELAGTPLLKSLPNVATFKRSQLLNDALEKLFHDAVFRKLSEKELKPAYSFVLHLILEEIRGRVAPAQPEAESESTQEAKQVLIHIENHLFENLDPNDIADTMKISRASLYRYFKSLTGMSVMNYVRCRRMEEARQLMKRGNLRLGDIALLVGYEDLYAFSNAYKNVFGVAPSKDTGVIAEGEAGGGLGVIEMEEGAI